MAIKLLGKFEGGQVYYDSHLMKYFLVVKGVEQQIPERMATALVDLFCEIKPNKIVSLSELKELNEFPFKKNEVRK